MREYTAVLKALKDPDAFRTRQAVHEEPWRRGPIAVDGVQGTWLRAEAGRLAIQQPAGVL